MRFFVTSVLVAILCSPVSYARDDAKECSARMLGLQNGRRNFKAESEHYTIDANTLSDLKVVERLFPGLNKTRTIFGAERLEFLLRNPYMSEDEITLRQNAVTELIKNESLRTSVTHFLNSIKASVQKRFQDHFYNFEKPENQDGTAIISSFFSACAVGCLALPQGWKYAPMLLYPKVFAHAPLEGPLSNLRWDLNLYKNVLVSAEGQIDPLSQSQSVALQEIGAVFDAIKNVDHPESVASMMPTYRQMLPYGKLSQLLDFLYAHSNWSLRKAQRQLLENKEKLALILSAIAELDTYLALAETALASPEFTAPQILRQDKPQISVVDGHNPFLYFKDREKSVPNSFDSSANFTNSDRI